MRYMLDTHILIYLIKNKPPGIAERSTRKPGAFKRLADHTRHPRALRHQRQLVRTLRHAVHPTTRHWHP